MPKDFEANWTKNDQTDETKPEDCEEVLVEIDQYKDGETSIEIAKYVKDYKTGGYQAKHTWLVGISLYADSQVIAWMPKPTKYTELKAPKLIDKRFGNGPDFKHCSRTTDKTPVAASVPEPLKVPTIYETDAGLGHNQKEYLILVEDQNYLCVGTKNLGEHHKYKRGDMIEDLLSSEVTMCLDAPEDVVEYATRMHSLTNAVPPCQ